jgi:enamine deaminase RidA (YjgF/YER057c/UK114 family)
MPRRIRNPATIHPPVGYSHVVESTGSRVAFIAGQAAIDADFRVVAGVSGLALSELLIEIELVVSLA